MRLTNQQILTLSEAIRSLDGQHVMQVVDGKAVAVFTSYKLDHKTRWNLAPNQGKLQSAIADFNRAKDALVMQHSEGRGSITPADAGFSAFADALNGLKEQTADLDLLTVPITGFSESEIPIAALTVLEPLIQES